MQLFYQFNFYFLDKLFRLLLVQKNINGQSSKTPVARFDRPRKKSASYIRKTSIANVLQNEHGVRLGFWIQARRKKEVLEHVCNKAKITEKPNSVYSSLAILAYENISFPTLPEVSWGGDFEKAVKREVNRIRDCCPSFLCGLHSETASSDFKVCT